jgi:hypothetical protein
MSGQKQGQKRCAPSDGASPTSQPYHVRGSSSLCSFHFSPGRAVPTAPPAVVPAAGPPFASPSSGALSAGPARSSSGLLPPFVVSLALLAALDAAPLTGAVPPTDAQLATIMYAWHCKGEEDRFRIVEVVACTDGLLATLPKSMGHEEVCFHGGKYP